MINRNASGFSLLEGLGRHKRKLLLIALMALMVALFNHQSSSFLKSRNIMSIGLEAGTVGIIACGMTFVIISGGIDLSCSSMIAINAMLCLKVFLANPDFNAYLMMGIVLVADVLIGLYHGLVVTKLKVPDFIVTLSSQIMLRGLTVIIAPKDAAGNIRNVNIANKTFTSLYSKVEIGDMEFRVVFLAFLVVVIISQIILKFTRKGTSIYAVGTSARSAILSGISVSRTKIFAYMYSALMTGIAALFMCARIGTGTADLANGYEMDVIAATIVGGVAFSGGKGDIIGTALGAIFLAMMQNGIYKYPDISTSLMPVILGSVIILSIMFDQLSLWVSDAMNSMRAMRARGA